MTTFTLLVYLLINSFSDIKKKQISLYVFIFFLGLCTILSFSYGSDINSIAYSLIPSIIVSLLSLIFPSHIGFGDSLILTICGISLGLYGTLRVIIISFTLLYIYSLFRAICTLKVKNVVIPYTPFVFISTLYLEVCV